MANVNAEVLDMVVRALQKDPGLRSTDLQERATQIDRAIGNLSGRQFHARYGLQARKRLASTRRGAKGRKPAGRKAAGRKSAAGKSRKSTARKSAGRKVARRKPGRRRAVNARSGRGASDDPVRDVLTDSYREKQDALQEAMDGAFQRSITADSVKGINELLSSIDRGIREFEQA